MPASILVAALILLPLIVGTCLAYAGFQSYKRRRFPARDVEQARRAPYGQRHGTELQDLARPGLVYNDCHGARSKACGHGAVATTLGGRWIDRIGGEGVVSYPLPALTVRRQDQDFDPRTHAAAAPDGHTDMASRRAAVLLTPAHHQPLQATTVHDGHDDHAAEIWARIERRSFSGIHGSITALDDEAMESRGAAPARGLLVHKEQERDVADGGGGGDYDDFVNPALVR